MEFLLTDDHLEKCKQFTSPIYPTIYSALLDAHIMFGNFVYVILPEGDHVFGRLIDVRLFEDVSISEVGMRDRDYFFR